ncbi:MAG: peptidoglycan DD-metalloendopeptidase family protein [Cellulosilyticaceae bacterium]
MTSLIEHIKNKKIYYITGAGVILAALVWVGVRNNAYEIQVDGQAIGIVKTKEEAENYVKASIEKLEKKLGKDIAIYETLTLEPVHSKKSDLTTEDTLDQKLKEKITYGVQAVEILIDGKVQAIVESKEISESILQGIAALQLPKESTVQLAHGPQPKEDVAVGEQVEDSVATDATDQEVAEEEAGDASEEAGVAPAVVATEEEVVTKEELASKPVAQPETLQPENALIVEAAMPAQEEPVEVHVGEVNRAILRKADGTPADTVKREYKAFDFSQRVEVRYAHVDESLILTEEEATDVLLSNTDEVIRYTMNPGDNVWDVAVAHGTTMDRILEINPQITDVTRMQIGEEIKLEAPDPILSIATTEIAIFKEIIPAEIEYVEDKTIYKGEEKVKQEGNDGVKELTVSVDKVNGREVSRTHLDEKMLREPVTKIIAYGTKEKPKNTNVVTPAKKGMFMHPLNGKGRISSQYGSRWGSYHRGIDIAASAGTPIYASASGTVIYSGYNSGGFGKLVMIDHGNGYQTYYAHNSQLNVKVGQKVSKGQKIAAVGSTGNSTGNHVHFEIRKNGKPINPYSYIY